MWACTGTRVKSPRMPMKMPRHMPQSAATAAAMKQKYAIRIEVFFPYLAAKRQADPRPRR